MPGSLVRSSGLLLFRSLLPSWRFFEPIEAVPEVHYRVAPHGADWSDWHDMLVARPRTLGSLWLNAAHNLYLAQQSLLEHLANDLEAAAETGQSREELVSYRLLCAWVEQRVREAHPASAELRYQFRLVQTEPEPRPFFVSGEHGTA